jgi:hypothetical protein
MLANARPEPSLRYNPVVFRHHSGGGRWGRTGPRTTGPDQPTGGLGLLRCHSRGSRRPQREPPSDAVRSFYAPSRADSDSYIECGLSSSCSSPSSNTSQALLRGLRLFEHLFSSSAFSLRATCKLGGMYGSSEMDERILLKARRRRGLILCRVCGGRRPIVLRVSGRIIFWKTVSERLTGPIRLACPEAASGS